MAEPITITDEEAAVVLKTILDHLHEIRAINVIDGIEESRRLGIEEDVSKEVGDRDRELKKVGTIRRRPATNIEMLRIVFQELRERLIVLPAIIDALENRLGHNQLVWRVDREFISQDLIKTVEANKADLRPAGVGEILSAYESVRDLIPDLVLPAKREVI